MTEGAGQFVLLVIYTTMGAVPKATVTGHEGRVCKLLNEYYVQYKGGDRERWVLVRAGCMCTCRRSGGRSVDSFRAHFNSLMAD